MLEHPESSDEQAFSGQLAERGVADLLAEYAAATDVGRRNRLASFFALCAPETEPRAASDLSVTLAYREAIDPLQRRRRLVEPTSKVLIVEGRPLEDMPIELIDLRDATILPDQTVVADGAYITEHVRHMSGSWLASGEGYDLKHLHNMDRASKTARLRLPEGRISLSDTSVYFLFQTIIGSVSFGHFLHDTMVQLIVFDLLHESYGDALIPLIVSETTTPLRHPGMEWLYRGLIGPLENAVHVRPGVAVDVRRAFTSNRLMHIGDGGISFQAVDHLRRRIFDVFRPSEGRPCLKRVYVSRKDVGSRETGNIRDIEHLLEEHGFTEIVVQQMTPQAVFDAMYDAEVIVGMHGSGLMNYVYTRASALVIELAYEGHLWDSILSFASACGHTPKRVMFEGGDVRIEDLRSLLSTLPA